MRSVNPHNCIRPAAHRGVNHAYHALSHGRVYAATIGVTTAFVFSFKFVMTLRCPEGSGDE